MILDYKNSSIHYTVTGDGPALVLLHGFLETLEMWEDFVPEFSRSHQVICIDLLGHGQTDCIGYVHTMEDMADAVLAILNFLNIKKAHVVGHSMGGYVALALAQKSPQLFEGLCLMNSHFEADTKATNVLRQRANKMVETNFESVVRQSFANLFAPESRATYKQDYEDALQVALDTSVQGYIAGSEGMRLRPNRLEVFKKLDAKKLLILGKKDSLVNCENLIRQIEHSDIDYTELSEGHMSHIENKSELSYFLLRFIEN